MIPSKNMPRFSTSPFVRVAVGISAGALIIGALMFVARSLGSSETVLTSGTQTETASTQQHSAFYGLTDRQRVTVSLADQRLQVEVVNTPDSIEQGLSQRSEIGSDGMLFIFPYAHRARFWMVGMQFDLDLIWINQGRVVEVTTQVPAPGPGTPDVELPIYQPQQAVDMVLEVPAGSVALWGVSEQDQLRLVSTQE